MATLSQTEIDELWKIEVERRIDEVESGKVKTIPGEQVFAEIEKMLMAKRLKKRTKPKKIDTKR